MSRRACFYALAALAVLGLSCGEDRSSEGEPRSECVELVEKIERCDPTAGQMSPAYRDALRHDCPASQRPCAEMPTSDEDDCVRFMGCLYDGP